MMETRTYEVCVVVTHNYPATSGHALRITYFEVWLTSTLPKQAGSLHTRSRRNQPITVGFWKNVLAQEQHHISAYSTSSRRRMQPQQVGYSDMRSPCLCRNFIRSWIPVHVPVHNYKKLVVIVESYTLWKPFVGRRCWRLNYNFPMSKIILCDYRVAYYSR